MSVATPTPALGDVFETALYVSDLAAAELFYGGVLGLPKVFAVPGRQLVFRAGNSYVLIFDPDSTEAERIVINGSPIPLHGCRGMGHLAWRIAKEGFGPWRERLRRASVEIESEVTWPNGAHSLYFRDPFGNSLELATPTLWETPSLSAAPPPPPASSTKGG